MHKLQWYASLKSQRVAFFLLLTVLLLFSVVPVLAQDEDQEDCDSKFERNQSYSRVVGVSMEVLPAIGSPTIRSEYLPFVSAFRVKIANLENFEKKCTLRLSPLNSQITTAEKNIVLPGNGKVSEFLLLPTKLPTEAIEVKLIPQDGPESIIVLSIHEQSSVKVSALECPDKKLQDCTTKAATKTKWDNYCSPKKIFPVEVFFLEKGAIPEQPSLLSSLAALIVPQPLDAQLTEEMQTSLRKWVVSGGTLIFIDTKDNLASYKSKLANLKDILPVNEEEILKEATLPYLGGKCTEKYLFKCEAQSNGLIPTKEYPEKKSQYDTDSDESEVDDSSTPFTLHSKWDDEFVLPKPCSSSRWNKYLNLALTREDNETLVFSKTVGEGNVHIICANDLNGLTTSLLTKTLNDCFSISTVMRHDFTDNILLGLSHLETRSFIPIKGGDDRALWVQVIPKWNFNTLLSALVVYVIILAPLSWMYLVKKKNEPLTYLIAVCAISLSGLVLMIIYSYMVHFNQHQLYETGYLFMRNGQTEAKWKGNEAFYSYEAFRDTLKLKADTEILASSDNYEAIRQKIVLDMSSVDQGSLLIKNIPMQKWQFSKLKLIETVDLGADIVIDYDPTNLDMVTLHNNLPWDITDCSIFVADRYSKAFTLKAKSKHSVAVGELLEYYPDRDAIFHHSVANLAYSNQPVCYLAGFISKRITSIDWNSSQNQPLANNFVIVSSR